MGDGGFNFKGKVIKLQLAEKDLSQIEKFSIFTGKNYLKASTLCLGKKFTSYQVTLCEKEKFQTLVEGFDIKERKTYNPPGDTFFNSDIDFVSCFIGLIDADGHIGKAKLAKNPFIKIECHECWSDFYMKLIEKINIYFGVSYVPNYRFDKKRNTFSLKIGNSSYFKILLKFIKDNNLPVLERKWDKAIFPERKLCKDGKEDGRGCHRSNLIFTV